MALYRKLVRSVADAVRLETRLTFSWLGVSSPTPPPDLARSVDDDTANAFLLQKLQQRIYISFFCAGAVRPIQEGENAKPPDVRKDPDFVAALSAANVGRGSWRKGWRLCSESGDGAVIARDGLTLRVAENGYRPDNEAPGTEEQAVEVLFPKEQLGISPGFYMAHSDVEFFCERPDSVLRLYWNVTATASALLMANITERLNGLRLPFEFKVMHDAIDPQRCDRAVLYLRQNDWVRALPEIRATHRKVSDGLRPAVPALVKQLLPGLGLAENPAAGGSYGKHRASLLAKSLLLAKSRGETDCLPTVEACFRESGIDLDKPYLNPGSENSYNLSSTARLTSKSDRADRADRAAEGDVNHTPGALLESAHAIAQQLARDALWHGEHCTWLAPAPVTSTTDDNLHTTLNATLYRGNSGLALFLAESYKVLGDPALRRTAVGAMERALATVRSEQDADSCGLYSGVLGVALCAVRIGLLLDEPKLVVAGQRLVRWVRRARADNGEFDIVNGTAGGVLALVAINGMTADPHCMEYAIELGNRLCKAARASELGCSWRSPRVKAQHDLTGYSHGAAGAAHALFELFGVTGDPRFAECATGALRYERHWFDANAKNWPDFRLRSTERRAKRRNGAVRRYPAAWCHGAPGIAISRLRIHRLTNDPTMKAEAADALATTRASVERSIASTAGNLCLCHGLLGNADILRLGCEAMEDEREDNRRLYAKAMSAGAQYFANDPQSREKLLREMGPGLMVGMAGIGYSFLRGADADLPSILSVGADAFGDGAVHA